MLIQFLTEIVGPGIHHRDGETADVARADALRFIAARQAVAVEPETATTTPPTERAVKRPRR